MSRTHLRGWDYVTTPFTLGDGDTLWLDPGITLEMLQRVPAVTLTGGRMRLHNAGEISTYGEHAVAGTLTGPFDIRIVNEGTIHSKSGTPGADILLDSAEGTTGTLRILNSGGSQGPSAPAGFGNGIDLSALHADRVTLINTGQIGGLYGHTIYAGSFGADIVENSGTIIGNVMLGAGDDRFRDTGDLIGSIYGGDGDDRISAGDGNDHIYGGAGRDVMAGGLGGDWFFFDTLSDSAPDRAHADVIRGYDKPSGDFIILSGIDADTTLDGNQAFAFVGTAAFSGAAGELRVELTQGGAVLYADVDGDARSDFALVVQGAVTTPADLALAL